ncbi:unnamed protein product [Haemonchus placei]|uniref:PDZ domain-containing protein n=1 Tax=Haemonchus placei TaxID=6290 RepID=A0A158QRA7_HAEPC|nr:unnamed protein product [Haemonchus placei]
MSKPGLPTVQLRFRLGKLVTAIRYPASKRIETVPSSVDDSRGTTFISHISHHIQPPPPLTTTAASRTATVSGQSSTSPERHRVMPPTTAYRTVDIPFDESPAAYQPKKDENVRTVTVTMGTHPVQKGLGFSITIERGRPTIDSVIVSSPADRAGLLIGDRVISINGEDLKDKYPSAINRMLHEAARLGEAEVCIERKDAPRADHPSPREYNSLPRSTSAGVIPQSRRDSSISASQRSAAVSPSRSYFDSRTSTRTEYRTVNGPSSDYKVTSMHEKTGPGKLTDFVPESERAAAKAAEDEKKGESFNEHRDGLVGIILSGSEYSYRRASEEEPRLIRNYDLPPAKPATTRVTPIPVTTSPFAAPRRISTENESVSAVPKRSTLPRDTHIHEESRHLEDDTVAGRSYLRKTLRQSLSPTPPVGILRRSPEIDYSPPSGAHCSESRTGGTTTTTRDYRSDRWTCSYPTSHRRSRSSYELRDRGGQDYSFEDRYLDRDAYTREKLELDEMYRKRTTQERVGRRDYVPRTTVVPIRRVDGDYRSIHTPRPFHIPRSKSSDYVLEKEYDRRDDYYISEPYRRLYDRASDYSDRFERRGYDIDIQRDYDRARDAERRALRDTWRQPRYSKSVERRTEEHMEYEEKEKRMWIPERRVVVGVNCVRLVLLCFRIASIQCLWLFCKQIILHCVM